MKIVVLSKSLRAILDHAADELKDHPTCSITVTGYTAPFKAQQSLVEKKLETIKNYLVETSGISADRIMTDKVIGGGDLARIEIKSN